MKDHTTGFIAVDSASLGTSGSISISHNLGLHLREMKVYAFGSDDGQSIDYIQPAGVLDYQSSYKSHTSCDYEYWQAGWTVHEVSENEIKIAWRAWRRNADCTTYDIGPFYHLADNGYGAYVATETPYVKFVLTDNVGQQGPRGPKGATGSAGTTTITLSPNDCKWKSDVSYSYQDIVHYKGRVYESLDNNNVGNQPDLNCTSPAPAGYSYVWKPLTQRLFTIETSPSGLNDDIHIIAD